MCGIVGYWSAARPLAEDALVAMRDALTHRGPDGAGLHLSPTRWMGLGHRRLAILDLSPLGHQPMLSPAGDKALVYNGEIYNYLELKQELEALGRRFRSRSDTEVLLAAHEVWGEACLDRFNGMWAYALWDETAGSLLLARDRFGIKPLYYHWDGATLLFASEAKAIFASGLVRPRACDATLLEFVHSGVVDGLEESCFAGVRQVPPGHVLRVDEQGARPRRWWRPPLEECRQPLETAVLQCRELLDDAVRVSLRSDVPLGICLSGGLDSGSICAVAHAVGGVTPVTFSAYYEDEGCDEREFIRPLVRQTGAEAHFIRPEHADVLATARRIVWHLEAPSKSIGVFSQWAVMEAARSRVTVLLDGQGGDEVFAGYPYHLAYAIRGLAMRDPQGAWRMWRGARGLWGEPARAALRYYLRRLWDRLGPSRWREALPGAPAPQGLRPKVLADAGVFGPAIVPELACASLRDRLLHDIGYEMLPSMLKYEDRLGMAFSLESRVPLLDYRLVEFALRQPAEHLISPRGWSKFLLRKAMAGRMPDAVTWRADKKGFPTPINRLLAAVWPQARELVLDSPLVRRLFETDRLRHDMDAALASRDSRLVWQRLTMAIWSDLYGVA